MATKKDIMNELSEAGIDFDPNSTVAELKKILKANPASKSDAAKEAEEKDTLDPGAKNFAEKNPARSSGSEEIGTGPGLKIEKDVDARRLKELEKSGKLYGWDPATRTASYKG